MISCSALWRSPAIPATVLVGAAPRVGNRARPRRRRPYPRERLEGSCLVQFLPSPSSEQRAEASRPRRRRSGGQARRPASIRHAQSPAALPSTVSTPPRARWSSTTAESGTPAAAAIDVRRRASTSMPSSLSRPSSAQNRSTVSSAATLSHSPAFSPPKSAATTAVSPPRRRSKPHAPLPTPLCPAPCPAPRPRLPSWPWGPAAAPPAGPRQRERRRGPVSAAPAMAARASAKQGRGSSWAAAHWQLGPSCQPPLFMFSILCIYSFSAESS